MQKVAGITEECISISVITVDRARNTINLLSFPKRDHTLPSIPAGIIYTEMFSKENKNIIKYDGVIVCLYFN